MNADTIDMLVRNAQRYETIEFIVGDPSWFMHQVTGDDNREAMAFVASGLSYGSRQQFMPKIQSLLDDSGGDMHEWVRSGAYAQRFAAGDVGCFYRLHTCATMRCFLDAYRQILVECGTLGAMLRRQGATTGIQAVEAICRAFAEAGSSGVVPKDAASACKRVCMFLRWMGRDGSPVDLGLWSNFLQRSTLIMPLDTHVLTQARALQLLTGKSASMATARRLTDIMATVFPGDPVRGDFALFGYGVDNSRR